MKTTPMNETLYSYVMDHNVTLDESLEELAVLTGERVDRNMQISKDQGVFLYQCMRMINPKRVLEVGTFTGYSSISMALGLETDAKLYSLDIDDHVQKIAQEYLHKTKRKEFVEYICGDANDSLDRLLSRFGEGSFDFAFLDADKENYDAYYEKSLRLLRPGGFIAADNVIWDGRVVNSPDDHPSTSSLVRFNDKVKKDQRVEAGMLHIADGIYLIRKK